MLVGLDGAKEYGSADWHHMSVVVTLQIRIDVPLMRLGEFHMVCASKSKRWVAWWWNGAKQVRLATWQVEELEGVQKQKTRLPL